MLEIVSLSRVQVAACLRVARIRERDIGRNNRGYCINYSNRTLLENNIEGVCAELAFGILFGVWAPLSIRPDGEDLIINRVRVDVKAAPSPMAHLIVSEEKEDHAPDEYALMIGYRPNYWWAGNMLAREVFQTKYYRTGPGKRPGFWVPQSDLHAPSFARTAA